MIFLFKWPKMHTFVLVRILQQTIALYPTRSKTALLYFYHRHHPTQPTKKKRWMKRWLSEKEVRTRKVTLDDVLHETQSEHWIHAPCTLGPLDPTQNHIVLFSLHQHPIRLIARSLNERNQFVNLFGFYRHIQSQTPSLPPPSTETYALPPYLQHYLQRSQSDIQHTLHLIQQTQSRIENAKHQITCYQKNLDAFDLSQLYPREESVDYQHRLTKVNYSVVKHSMLFEEYKQRLSKIKKGIELNDDYLKKTKDKYGQVKNRLSISRWFYGTITHFLLPFSH
ncbi:hypothetical protein G6F33_003138 [Rhizopus arrhizus]|nr:hypothetical protein G6F33_003138 [Rhizopus arrhizus]KAG0949468.1 hypothetical protein G6F32_005476 [Rhizopus arrhizus]